MLRKSITFIAIGVSLFSGLFAAGCANKDSKPYGLTGQSQLTAEERREQARWTDSKGHYRPDLKMMNVPQRP